MARKSKKSSNGTNGVLEAERPDVDSTEVPEFIDPVCGQIAEHEEAFAAQDETPESADASTQLFEPEPGVVESRAQAKIDAITGQVAAEIAEEKATRPVVVVEGMASTPKPPVADRDPLQEKIYYLNEQAFVLKAEWEHLAKQTKGKKAEWEDALDEIQRLIRATHESFPLFPDKPKPKPEPFEASRPEPEIEDEPEDDGAATILQIAQGTEGEDAAAEEDWKTIGVSALVAYGMPKKYVAILSEGGIHTIGDISALGDKHKSLTDIKGVGEAAETKINDALDGLWKARAEPEPTAVVQGNPRIDDGPNDFEAATEPDDLPTAEEDEIDGEAGYEQGDIDDFTPDFPDDETGEGFESEFADDDSQDDGDTIDEMDPEGGSE